ncbi:MAG: non-canonical purine NTP pyrophosphatase [Spirochaetota bacterium]
MMDLLLATNNHHKKREFERIFEDARVLLPEDLGIAFSHEETETTFLGNALGKATALEALLPPEYRSRNRSPDRKTVVIADDSGVCVAALDGRPGVYSARYGSETLSDTERNERLLSELQGVADRRAHYVCCMVAIEGDDRFGVVQETWHGEIAGAASTGTGGFGYDPIFYLPDQGLTVAEISDREKDALSHRGKAARRLWGYLTSSETCPGSGSPSGSTGLKASS